MSVLQQRLAGQRNSAQQDDVEARIAAKMATGKFKDTGKKYNEEEAKADATNPQLRMTAQTDDAGNLTWRSK